MSPLVTEGPWKTTRSIGGTCKHRDVLSLPVLMAERLTTLMSGCQACFQSKINPKPHRVRIFNCQSAMIEEPKAPDVTVRGFFICPAKLANPVAARPPHPWPGPNFLPHSL